VTVLRKSQAIHITMLKLLADAHDAHTESLMAIQDSLAHTCTKYGSRVAVTTATALGTSCIVRP